MSQNRKDEARGSEDVEEDYRSYSWKCDVCNKVKYTGQIAAFVQEGLSPCTIICWECTEKNIAKNIEEYEEKKAQEKKKDASKKEEDENMDCGWEICD